MKDAVTIKKNRVWHQTLDFLQIQVFKLQSFEITHTNKRILYALNFIIAVCAWEKLHKLKIWELKETFTEVSIPRESG